MYTITDLRNLPASDLVIDRIYDSIINKHITDFYWDPSSTIPDDGVMSVKPNSVSTASGRLLRYFEEYIMVDWFIPAGAPGNSTDNSAQIQQAIDFAISNERCPEVLFSGGNYVGSNIVVAKRNGTDYDPVTLKLRGQSSVVGNATVLNVTNKNGFGIGVMISKQVEIENITFHGQSPLPSVANVITWTDNEWTSSGVRDNAFSPHAGIVVDPFHASLPSGDQYPGMSAYYNNTGTGGTSQLTIRNCTFTKFVTAIIESPTGVITNGDNVKVQDSYFEGNKVAWAACQTQSRANTIENCYFTFHQCIVNGVDYGASNGTPPNVNRCNIAGGTKYLYHIGSSFSSLTFNQTYAESVFSLGRSANLPVQFTDCDIRIYTEGFQHAEGTFNAPHLAEGGQVSFKGGSLEWFDNWFSNGFPFYVTNLSFDGVTLGGLPLNQNKISSSGSLLNKTVFNNCNFLAGAVSRDVWQANSWDGGNGFPSDFFYSRLLTPGNSLNYVDEGLEVRYRSLSPKIEQIAVDGPLTLTIDAVNHTASFTTSQIGGYQVGDVLTIGEDIGWSNDIYTATPAVLGQIYEIIASGSNETVKIKYVPFGIDANTSHVVLINRIPTIVGKTIGNIVANSNQISLAKYAGPLTFLPGTSIKGAGIPAGTRVTGVSGGTITMSRNATQTLNDVHFYDAIIKAEAIGYDPTFNAKTGVFMNTGDIMWNSRLDPQNDAIDHWVCTKGGFLDSSSSPRAQFIAVNTSQSGTYSPVVTNGTNISAVTIGNTMYTRNGNIVTVNGTISVTPLAAGTVSFDLSLPLPSAIANADDAAGVISNNTVTGDAGAIVGKPVNHTVTFTYAATIATLNYLPYSFTYILK